MTCNRSSEKTTSCSSTSKAQAKCTCQKGLCECEACPNSTKTPGPGTYGDVKERFSTCGCNGSGEACTCPPGQCVVVLAPPALVPLASVHVTTAPTRLKKKSTPALAADLVPAELIVQTSAL
ncbi:hypothetical protein I307_04891 [Cryptococcus deuterogattii 99/473]|uniref:Unplaced genomic scaffold supercont1.9, whole genome shotgun sequence n=1 Tax=Cryptococcus deuterogattii Ram5 TaxID=1296110 RepID=A0A0D0V0K6_9TREE|nr:hypothetical protein I352_05620 [Cryptococcus deuterogattii MMRL2647]KIR40009.1 hypothetical protein I313_03930 [Cryptococcus deuterogattii Ram5]KIR71403.1 hypothetical protein I310_04710 [Cryptococcus deuterogattii CA1014]KIR96265.1 hypothetical protein L804_06389 [Cryptococcus deuterogattii 2001/935-1]KIY55706.1 hypothetical protein I307_04891 [Cryptococcus deuterogattii 99/473]